MDLETKIQAFLDGDVFAVAGASSNREKYGNKVLRVYQQNGRTVFPINPRVDEIEGLACYADIASIPRPVHGLSIVTPPTVTERLVKDAAAAGIRHLWIQPGAESDRAIEIAESSGMAVIAGGPCVLVTLRYRE